MNRNLDGIYFRVQRGDKYENICFSDLTDEEREQIGKGRSAEWWKSVACHLADVLIALGEQLDLVME